MNELLPTIFLALVCAGTGFAFGALVSGLRGGKSSAASPAPGLVEVARLRRDLRNNLIVEVKEKRFRSAAELTPEQKTYLIRLFESWRLWLGLPTVEAPKQPGAAEIEIPTPALDPAKQTGGRPPSPSPSAYSPPDRPTFGGQGSLSGRTMDRSAQPERVNMSPVDLLARALKSETPISPPKSIAAQVDEIVQEMLVQPSRLNPQLHAKGIRLMELPGKGMVVMVGLDQFDGVEAVPDPEVRNLLKAAVAEWERRAGEAIGSS
jgi:hypothetical protein